MERDYFKEFTGHKMVLNNCGPIISLYYRPQPYRHCHFPSTTIVSMIGENKKSREFQKQPKQNTKLNLFIARISLCQNQLDQMELHDKMPELTSPISSGKCSKEWLTIQNKRQIYNTYIK